MSTQVNPYIEVLKFGNNSQGVRYSEIVAYLQNENISFHSQPVTFYDSALQRVFMSSFESLKGEPPFSIESSDFYFLKSDAVAYLLSYEALEQAKRDSAEAREEAKAAIKIATYSLWVTIGAAIISAILQVILA